MEPTESINSAPGPIGFFWRMVALSIAYGMVHDLVTAHVAVDYFTVHHPKLVESTSPIVMALMWGFLATFWVGGAAGAVLIAANRFGRWPQLEWGRIFSWAKRGVAILWLGAMAVMAGVYAIASLAPMDKRGPTFEHDRRLVAVALAHGFSYSGATLAILVLALVVAVKRSKAARVPTTGI